MFLRAGWLSALGRSRRTRRSRRLFGQFSWGLAARDDRDLSAQDWQRDLISGKATWSVFGAGDLERFWSRRPGAFLEQATWSVFGAAERNQRARTQKIFPVAFAPQARAKANPQTGLTALR